MIMARRRYVHVEEQVRKNGPAGTRTVKIYHDYEHGGPLSYSERYANYTKQNTQGGTRERALTPAQWRRLLKKANQPR
jgi:hypothetical protein